MGLTGGLRGFKGASGMNFIFFVFNPPKRFRVAFSCLWGGEHVFVHVFAAFKGALRLKGRLKGGLRGGFKG